MMFIDKGESIPASFISKRVKEFLDFENIKYENTVH